MRGVLLVLLCVCLAVGAMSATVVVPTDFRGIVAGATLIVRGTVTDVRAIVTDGGIESVATVSVSAILKGQADAFVSVRVPGGTVGRYRRVMVGAPTLRSGQQAVFFLVPGADFGWRPVALSAGIARVEQDVVGRRAVVRSASLASAASGVGRVVRGETRQPLSVDEFESLVQVMVAAERRATGRAR